MTSGSATATAIRWRRSGTSCRCSSRSTRSRSPSRRAPTARAVARFAAGAERYSTAGCARCRATRPTRATARRTRETWFDDNGWWGLAFVNAYRATGVTALPDRRPARAALHRGRGWDAGRAAASGGTPTTRTRPARRSPPTRCWRRCSTSRPTRLSLSRQARKFLAWANTRGLQRGRRPVRRQQPRTRPRSTTSRRR